MNNKMQKTGGEPVDIEKITTYLETMNLANKLTKSEVQQFIEISHAFGLNPFKREIYASKFGDKMSVIVGFETYIKRAERSGLLSGWDVKTDGMINHADVPKSDITATITIHRKDWNHPFIHSVHFSEYFQNSMIWKTKPITMIKKVAMAQGFRLCFSDELGGMPYTSDEMPIETVNVDHQVIESKPEIAPVKKSPGRPKKQPESITLEPETISDDYILKKISEAIGLTDLKRVWDDCKGCQNNPEMVAAFTKRKIEIQLESATENELWTMAEKEKNPIMLSMINKQIESINQTQTTENGNDELF
jgi:phage recombination protein Bet